MVMLAVLEEQQDWDVQRHIDTSTVKIEMNKNMNLYFDLNQISLFNKDTKERI